MFATASRLLLRRQACSSSSPVAHYAAKELGSISSCSSVGSSTKLLLRSFTSFDHPHHHRQPPALRFHVEPGATLSIDSGPETRVEVLVGELHDAIEASWTLREGGGEGEEGGSMPSSTPSTSTSSSSSASLPVEARQVDGRVSLRVASSSSTSAPSPVSLLSVRIPSRYCSLRATTRGGDLFVEAVREASLDATTSPGGAVSLGTIRATVAKVLTGGGSGGRGGGSVSARELVADCLSVSTEEGGGSKSSSSSGSSSSSSGGNSNGNNGGGGGGVSVDRLVARRGAVRTGGGSLRVRSAFYGERLDLDSGGGAVSVLGLTPRAASENSSNNGKVDDDVASSSSSNSSLPPPPPPLATIRSHGGSLSVEGVEGDADVDSGGGELSLHLLRGARGVRARSGGGNGAAAASVAVAPELLSSAGMIAGDGIVLISSSSSSSSSTGRLKDVSSAADEAEASLEARWNVSSSSSSSNEKKNTSSCSSSSSSSSPSPSFPENCFAPLTPSSAAAASTAGRRGGGDRVRDHGPLPSTVILVDARPGGRVSVVEESWADAVARRARGAMEEREREKKEESR